MSGTTKDFSFGVYGGGDTPFSFGVGAMPNWGNSHDFAFGVSSGNSTRFSFGIAAFVPSKTQSFSFRIAEVGDQDFSFGTAKFLGVGRKIRRLRRSLL